MIQIVAHRGASATHRENSPASWRAAVAAGADAVESDVRITADGHVVCIHDADLARLAGRPDRVADLTAAALAGVTAGGVPAAPVFADALGAVSPSVPLMLDVKDETPAGLDALSAALPEPDSRPIVLALHTIESVRRFAGSGHTVLAMIPQPGLWAAFLDAGADAVRLWERDAEPTILAAIAARTVPIWVTAGGGGTGRAVGDIDRTAVSRLATLGVDAILVNDPAGARQLLEGLAA
ncbi:glycerophosphodiester phosphodiesterase [Acuticoccus sediminis]|uniref:glycerophosphodiester phosphodiesterase n=1 Tax=Acuticoccus sediminis TaxID=2184697 RepID=UPI001CFC6164|nr:glycerophosphodiester phosphodiesterase family protein [Acuticoccus sediminis]